MNGDYVQANVLGNLNGALTAGKSLILAWFQSLLGTPVSVILNLHTFSSVSECQTQHGADAHSVQPAATADLSLSFLLHGPQSVERSDIFVSYITRKQT